MSHKILDKYLEDGITSDEIKIFQETYLGFMVIKPLPKTFIGKTCLKPYDSLINSDDKKCITREYCVDLLGYRSKLNQLLSKNKIW